MSFPTCKISPHFRVEGKKVNAEGELEEVGAGDDDVDGFGNGGIDGSGEGDVDGSGEGDVDGDPVGAGGFNIKSVQDAWELSTR